MDIRLFNHLADQLINKTGGGSRIRTHGGVNLNGFQDRRFRPLSHPSIFYLILILIFIIPGGGGQYFCPQMKAVQPKADGLPVDRCEFLWFRRQ
jgi:hypothetical protein